MFSCQITLARTPATLRFWLPGLMELYVSSQVSLQKEGNVVFAWNQQIIPCSSVEARRASLLMIFPVLTGQNRLNYGKKDVSEKAYGKLDSSIGNNNTDLYGVRSHGGTGNKNYVYKSVYRTGCDGFAGYGYSSINYYSR